MALNARSTAVGLLSRAEVRLSATIDHLSIPQCLPKSQLRETHEDGLQERYWDLVGVVHDPVFTAVRKSARDIDLVARFMPPPPITPPPLGAWPSRVLQGR